jgi:hypothetical protein
MKTLCRFDRHSQRMALISTMGGLRSRHWQKLTISVLIATFILTLGVPYVAHAEPLVQSLEGICIHVIGGYYVNTGDRQCCVMPDNLDYIFKNGRYYRGDCFGGGWVHQPSTAHPAPEPPLVGLPPGQAVR